VDQTDPPEGSTCVRGAVVVWTGPGGPRCIGGPARGHFGIHGILNSAKYQRHVDGLRAVAVLCVVFYHLGHRWFRGGYVGVDVFFVISGFLITRLILDEIYDTSSFSFKRFYIRRMRRLFPALSATLVVSLGLAIALFSPEQFQRFGRSLAAAALSVSNVLFWTESGYFDVDSHLKPLLHTWSLGVEEQFYLFWPAFLWLVTRSTKRSWHPYVLASVGLGSLLLNQIWVGGKFDVAYVSSIFFLTPFRMFELCMGAMALYAAPVFVSRRWLYELGMAAGLILIGYSVFAYSDRLVFPYYYALVPCVGAFLVILSGHSRFFGRVLTNPVAVGIGLISYSMYLVHWPTLIFYEHYKFHKHYNFEQLRGAEDIGVFVLTILLAMLMYFFVEKPFRRNAPTRSSFAPQRVFVLSSLGTMAAIGLIGFQIATSAGWVWRNPRALTATEIADGKQRRFNLSLAGCNITVLNDSTVCRMERPVQILVFGDSHEPDGYNAFSALYGKDPAVNLISFGAFNGCDLQFGASGPFSTVEGCRARLAQLTDVAFVSSLKGLVFSQNKPFHETAGDIWRVIRHLKSINKELPIVVLGGFINLRRDCTELYSEFHTFNACKDPQFVVFTAFKEREAPLIDEARGIEYLYIDKMRLLCRQGTLESCVIEAGGEPAFYDSHHLSLGFSIYIGDLMARAYGDELQLAGFPFPWRSR
jgi:peptidoglycan/LPS O-acetylase OafA/YrhL